MHTQIDSYSKVFVNCHIGKYTMKAICGDWWCLMILARFLSSKYLIKHCSVRTHAQTCLHVHIHTLGQISIIDQCIHIHGWLLTLPKLYPRHCGIGGLSSSHHPLALLTTSFGQARYSTFKAFSIKSSSQDWSESGGSWQLGFIQIRVIRH